MRELKFRIWNKNKRIFYSFELDALIRNAFGKPTLVDGGAMEGVTKPWQQYTGLKDRNGKEIYEGDVVRTQRTDSKADIKQVHFLDGVFGLYFGNYLEALRNFYMVQVVGNIYENPELLEGNK